MSVTTTDGIRIEVQSRYLEDKSSPQERYYLFAYDVEISNVGTETAQLIARRWHITDADGNQEVVEGPGVVGEQPILAPGSRFRYTSYCPIPTEVGSMHGHYQMVTAAGRRFDAAIEPFTLATPNSLN